MIYYLAALIGIVIGALLIKDLDFELDEPMEEL